MAFLVRSAFFSPVAKGLLEVMPHPGQSTVVLHYIYLSFLPHRAFRPQMMHN
jgi:hypothetical protein